VESHQGRSTFFRQVPEFENDQFFRTVALRSTVTEDAKISVGARKGRIGYALNMSV
jgi:hypothetical protein